MGIKDLNEFLKKWAPRSRRVLRADLFAGRRIAVDTPILSMASFSAAYSGYIEKIMPVSDMLLLKQNDSSSTSSSTISPEVREEIRERVMRRIAKFCADFIRLGITPIFIFDGVSADEKTSGARARRHQTRKDTAARIEALRIQILDTDPLFRKPEDIAALRKLLRQSPPVSPAEDLAAVRSFIQRETGLLTLDAPDEAERFGAYLASKGDVAAVWTTDTDTYAFGAPIVITGFNTDKQMESSSGGETHIFFDAIVLPLILKQLRLTRPQFVDLCIMFQCDFNTRIKGIGAEGAWKMIADARDAHPDADRLIEIAALRNPHIPEEGWSGLNAERCREIFLDLNFQCEAARHKYIDQINHFILHVRDILNQSVRVAAIKGMPSGKSKSCRMK